MNALQLRHKNQIDNFQAGHSAGFLGSGDSPIPHSLVKGSKCPTPLLEPVQKVFDHINLDTGEVSTKSITETKDSIHSIGSMARVSHREWSGEWRINLVQETPTGQPPLNIGDRITEMLTSRAATKIGESCDYVTRKHGGFTTFLTLTLTPEARARITAMAAKGEKKTIPPFKVIPDRKPIRPQNPIPVEDTREPVPGAEGSYCLVDFRPNTVGGVDPSGPFCRVKFEWASSIQKEASRFFDGLQKMNQRGWVPAYSRGSIRRTSEGGDYTTIYWNTEGRKIGGREYGPVERLYYLWVAESPENEAGEPNPHIHVLIRWSIPWGYFPAWSKRIENLWGQGFAHLEKLKAKEAAGYYIAKAAGYLSKAANQDDQGAIRGNRYGISQNARAPGWVASYTWAWGVLGHLMNEARQKWKSQIAPLKKIRDQASEDLQSAKKGTAKRAKIAGLLTKTRKEIADLPVFSKFQAVFRSPESADKFTDWAERNGWTPKKRPPSLWLGTWINQRRKAKEARSFQARFGEDEDIAWWQFWRRWSPPENEFNSTIEQYWSMYA